jgi:hypothetical protein
MAAFVVQLAVLHHKEEATHKNDQGLESAGFLLKNSTK